MMSVEEVSEADRIALAICELANYDGYRTLILVLQERLEYWNGKFLETADRKYQGAYYAILDLHNTLIEYVRMGKKLLTEDDENV